MNEIQSKMESAFAKATVCEYKHPENCNLFLEPGIQYIYIITLIKIILVAHQLKHFLQYFNAATNVVFQKLKINCWNPKTTTN